MIHNPPVIILGMHRSGTSLVTRLLAGMGLFTGWRNTRNQESPFFGGLNKWVFRQAGAGWDNPAPVLGLLADERVRPLVEDYLRLSVSGPRVIRYLGPARMLRGPSLIRQAGAWAWKDPRNVYTLPLWLAVFPEARVIHIHRHGVDVAHSLKVRQERAFRRTRERYLVRRPLYRLTGKRGGFANSLRCSTLDGGLGLWREYMDQAMRLLAEIESPTLDLSYESLVAHPEEQLHRLVEFTGLEVSRGQLRLLAHQVDRSRIHGYQRDPRLRAFASDHRDLLAAFGYAP